MSTVVSIRARSGTIDNHQDFNLFFGQAPVQKLVKDEVKFSPSVDPYKAINEASQRLAEGKSVFTTCTE
ncbi:MAG: hypothetical protein V4629_06375 [Pseudomonadota bacterium]